MLILILEDDDAIRRMVTVLLTARGFTVLAASNGKDAIDWAQARPPDVAVLDLAMPGLYDGFEVIRRLRASPQTAKTPVIVLSARDDEGSRARARDNGANSFLPKPFSPGALLREIERFRPGSRRP